MTVSTCKRLAVLLCLGVLAACSTIPLSTIAAFSTFQESDFAKLDADALRVRISVPAGYALDMGSVRLQVSVGSGGKSRSEAFTLRTVAETHESKPGGWLSPATPVITTTCALAQASEPAFRELQRFVSSGRTESVALDVSLSLSAAPPGATAATAWVDVLLEPRQGYVTLVDGATLPLNATRVYGRKAE